MQTSNYPRSPKEILGGLFHLGRLFDKIRLRHAGQIQDYHYLTAGFDKYLLELLGIHHEELEQTVLAGGTDDQLLDWVKSHSKILNQEEISRWNKRILQAAPKDEGAMARFQQQIVDAAMKRGVAVETLPTVKTWSDLIDLDEGRI